MRAEEHDTPPQAARRPLSLRELFCLTTLAAVVVSLVLYREWTDHERWLLIGTLGGSLLGIVAARMRAWRGWLAGILAGTLGGLIVIGVIARTWLAEIERQAANSQQNADWFTEFSNQYLAAAIGTIAVALLLSLLITAAYQLVVWITAGNERGAVATLRQRPYLSLTAAFALAALGAAAWQWDRIASPQAWPPRFRIASNRSLTLLIGRLLSDHSPEPQHLALSRNGQWLAIHTDDARLAGPGETPRTLLYRLENEPKLVRFSKSPAEKIAQAAFSCDDDQLAWLELDREKGLCGDVHVVDLQTLNDTRLAAAPDNSYTNALIWLPGGRLVLNCRSSGYVEFQCREGAWSSKQSKVETLFEPRLGHALEYGERDVRVVDLESSRQIARLVGAAEWHWPSRARPPRSHVSVKTNGRFILIANAIHDLDHRTVRTWDDENGASELSFHTFTVAGQAVGSGTPHTRAKWQWLAEVPLAHRLLDWLDRPCIRFVDPSSGVELARTLPLGSGPTDVTFSHDGSRMAVYTWDEVLVYDVPRKFR